MRRRVLFPAVALLSVVLGVGTQSAHATLKFFYDPLTGNVSFDTSETRTGSLVGYGLSLPWERSFDFRLDNFMRVSNSTYYDKFPYVVGELTFGEPLEGLYTIGDVLPPGLSEQAWSVLFASGPYSKPGQGYHSYVDRIGGGQPPLAEFIYGRPAGPFANRTDILDPASIPWANSATLIYHAATGNVVFDTAGSAGGYTTAFQLWSASGFLTANFALSDSTEFLVETRSEVITVLGELIEPGQLSLGRILPSGLSDAAFRNYITSATFSIKAGVTARDLDLAADSQSLQFGYVPIPEPSAAFMIIIAAGTLGLRSGPCRAA